MKVRFSLLSAACVLCFLLASRTAPAQLAQQQCDRNMVGEGQLLNNAENVNSLAQKLYAAYSSGDKRQEDDLVKQLEGYANHREVTFSQEEKDKMEEIAQRPEVKAIIEATYDQERAEELEHTYRFNTSTCFLYPNPLLQDYVNQLGHQLVPKTSTQFYAFRISIDPRPNAWSYSTGSVYVSTGLMSMLDNEAQLAFVLAHEIAHVEHRHLYMQARGRILETLLEGEKERAARKKGMIIGGIAAAAGAAVGGATRGGSGAVGGAALGFGGAYLTTAIIDKMRVPKYTDYPASQENDADEFATHAVLEHHFDAREAPKVFIAVQNMIHRDDRVGGMGFSYGRVSSLSDRREHVQSLLTGALKADLEQQSKTGLQTTSPNWSLLISEVKRDNGVLALDYDLFEEARQNLEDAVAVRSTDPRAHLYLGRVYKLTARAPADDQKAMEEFMQAIRLDAGRSSYAQPHLEHALALLKQSDHSNLAEVQKEIKNYIELYKLNSGGYLPAGMHVLYDYLSLTGDDTWSDPQEINVSEGNAVMARETKPAPPPEPRSSAPQRVERKPK
jgi:predicted Zn-dependent protease